MLSMYSVFHQLPEYVVGEIQSYLHFNTLGKWRLVNKQAFLDVEEHVRKLAFDLESKGFLSACILQEPTGLWLGSAWFQFQSSTYRCRQCDGYQPFSTKFPYLNYDYQEAEMETLCGPCFLQNADVKQCSACHIHQVMWANNKCEQCHQFWCDDCSEDVIEMCFQCTDLFCHSCRLDTTCMNCQ